MRGPPVLITFVKNRPLKMIFVFIFYAQNDMDLYRKEQQLE